MNFLQGSIFHRDDRHGCAAVAYGQGRAELSVVWRWAPVFPAVYLANEIVWRASGFCGMRWITGAVAEASRRLFSYLSDHAATYFADRFAGALVNKIANAANGTEGLIAQWLWQFFPWIVGLVADLWISWIAHPWFAVGLLVWMAVYVPVNVLWVSRLHRLSFAYAEASSLLRGKMVHAASNIDAVQLAGEVAYERGTSASRSAGSASPTCASGGGVDGVLTGDAGQS